jgi:protease-4
LEEHKVVEDSIKSHPLKSLGSFTQPMTETERKILQGLVDDSFERFKGVVKAGRARFEESPEQLDDVATGQVFSADQARAKGLVDKIGYIEEAIDRAIELAGIDKEDTRVVKFQREISFFDILTGGEVRAPGMSLAELLDLTVPRAYYMCTRLPALESMISPRSR